MSTTIPEFVDKELALLGLELPQGRLEQMSVYLDLLLDANQRVNLTAVRQHDAAWRRHIIDSLTILRLLESDGPGELIDVGSGGGLPGIPLAIARPEWSIGLLEATGKKVRFLRDCISQMGLRGLRVVHGRAEEVGRDPAHRNHYQAAVCRAIGPMRELLEYTLPLVRIGGQVLAMKGPDIQKELDQAGDGLVKLGGGAVEVLPAYPPQFKVNTVIVKIHKQHPTPAPYPRRPGLPRNEPL